MKRIVLWALGTFSAVVLLFGYHTSTSGALSTSATTPFESSTTSGGSSASGGSSTPSGPGGSGGSGGSGGRSGATRSSATATTTATGSVAQTQWGPVQVQLTLEAGTITKVSVLQYPNGNSRDAEINDYALPVLTQETVDAQNAGIDMVSGATVTSTGYLQSLQSALDKAGI